MKRLMSLSLVLMIFLGGFIVLDMGFDLVSQKASGNTLFVGGTGGGNYSTIQSAIDDANSGDTVFVHSGEYEEGLLITKTITLQGEGRSTTIIDTSGNTFGVQIKETSYVNISGFAVKGANSANIKMSASNNNHIFENFVTESNSTGIGVSPGSNNLIELNDIRNNKKGIDISGFTSHDNIIRNNSLESIQDRAISLQQDAFDNIVEDNTIESSYVGLYIYESEGNIIENCQISSGNEGIRIIDVTDIVFQNNIISDNEIAIKILDNANIIISNCTLENSSSTDLLLGDSVYGNANITLYNTTFDETKVDILDPDTSLRAFWYLHVRVLDKDNNPQPGFSVRIMDNENGTFNETFTTDSEGRVTRLALFGFFENQTERVNYDPYNITAFNTTHTGFAVPELHLDNSKEVAIMISPYIVEIENRPPEITVIEPVSQTPTIKEGTSLLFTVDENDPDNEDSLQITWFLDDVLAQSSGSSYTFMADYMSSGDHIIRVDVDDGTESAEQVWTVSVENVEEAKEEHIGESFDSWTLIILVIMIIVIVVFLILIYKRTGKKQVPFEPEKEKE